MSFTYNTATIEALKATLSEERLEKYLVPASGDFVLALGQYVKNTRISEAFYTPLQEIEITLRNSLHRNLSRGFGTVWFDDAATGLRPPLTEMVANAKQALLRDGKPVESGRMVAELNFGFWVGLLGPRYETTLWRQHLRHAVSHRPRRCERKQVQGALNSIRRLRNRVAHHEPILHRQLDDDHRTIIDAIHWMCPQTSQRVRAHSAVPEALST